MTIDQNTGVRDPQDQLHLDGVVLSELQAQELAI